MTDFYVGVDPILVTKVRTVLLKMAAEGHPMKLCQGLRTAEYQHALWLKGRKDDGIVIDPHAIVTQCDGITTKSPHQAGLNGLGRAIDCCFEGLDPFGIKMPWGRFGQLVKEAGLVWGGDFRFKDLDHAELPHPNH